ncbi:hypothetical protein CO051_07335 [Candidatus Roizmanbacteria bacterium CG_4_9_14_0_2_um_filter_39_13]|uniref:Uncharacterized protein n=1 Tax=Candidatus Roizmanbacteria bacterium CG_4_9_14_0_2_um_filter_39_13 TaxID=1974839 RepID=A0A2M8EW96_9BACT|nr:MAG: hypothetical protein COY15_00285 [Candidatus Roizmanbacteria bacterium CG_4_10_14_0_2_um_filter_39_12]PJC30133.1 MAG: hypothetical protein CO051_07335 [Candidatus Roizmanbacteria bacterium CG_4_9_14_0_2_um_filter_39_13]
MVLVQTPSLEDKRVSVDYLFLRQKRLYILSKRIASEDAEKMEHLFLNILVFGQYICLQF